MTQEMEYYFLWVANEYFDHFTQRGRVDMARSLAEHVEKYLPYPQSFSNYKNPEKMAELMRVISEENETTIAERQLLRQAWLEFCTPPKPKREVLLADEFLLAHEKPDCFEPKQTLAERILVDWRAYLTMDVDDAERWELMMQAVKDWETEINN